MNDPASRINVLFVETGNHGGGSFESLYQNVAHLDRDRFHPVVVYLNRTHQLARMRRLGVEVHLIKDLLYNKYMPETIKRCMVGFGWILGKSIPKMTPLYELSIHFWPIYHIRKLVQIKQIDIIQLNNNVVRNFFCIVGLRGLHVPIISYLRSFIIKGIHPYMAKISNETVTRYVAYSEGVKAYWAAVGVDSENTEVIHNGIAIEDIEPVDVWKRMGIPPKRGPLIGCVGAVKVNRTYDYMIRSMPGILREEPEAHLIIIGTWMDRGLAERLLALIDRLHIKGSVTLHGHDSMAKRMIAGLDMLTIPYRVEPYGRILLEAWMARTPVITTNVGEIGKIIDHEQDGLLVEHGNEAEMGRAVMRIWRDGAFRKRVVEKGRMKVESDFSIRSCTRGLEALFQRIVLEKEAGAVPGKKRMLDHGRYGIEHC